MSELWIAHHSIETLQQPSQWTNYFEKVQGLLGAPLTHFDVNDPVKRKAASLIEVGNLVCAFKTGEDGRWLFGRFADIGVSLSVQHYRKITHYPNTVRWHVPLSFLEKPQNLERIEGLFDLGNQVFKPFYAYSDYMTEIAKKKKLSGAIDIQAELLGIFWLTYFNAAYVAFFGHKKFSELLSIKRGGDGGITVILGDRPESVIGDIRTQSETILGQQSFVNPSSSITKQRGRFVLTFQQLLKV